MPNSIKVTLHESPQTAFFLENCGDDRYQVKKGKSQALRLCFENLGGETFKIAFREKAPSLNLRRFIPLQVTVIHEGKEELKTLYVNRRSLEKRLYMPFASLFFVSQENLHEKIALQIQAAQKQLQSVSYTLADSLLALQKEKGLSLKSPKSPKSQKPFKLLKLLAIFKEAPLIKARPLSQKVEWLAFNLCLLQQGKKFTDPYMRVDPKALKELFAAIKEEDVPLYLQTLLLALLDLQEMKHLDPQHSHNIGRDIPNLCAHIERALNLKKGALKELLSKEEQNKVGQLLKNPPPVAKANGRREWIGAHRKKEEKSSMPIPSVAKQASQSSSLNSAESKREIEEEVKIEAKVEAEIETKVEVEEIAESKKESPLQREVVADSARQEVDGKNLKTALKPYPLSAKEKKIVRYISRHIPLIIHEDALQPGQTHALTLLRTLLRFGSLKNKRELLNSGKYEKFLKGLKWKEEPELAINSLLEKIASMGQLSLQELKARAKNESLENESPASLLNREKGTVALIFIFSALYLNGYTHFSGLEFERANALLPEELRLNLS